ncbi:MAG: acyl carrier protein [Candidatus Marinamargulisbacteria bacterium]
MTIKDQIRETLIIVMEENEITPPEITDDTVLLQTGLDSLGFAILVATLEEKIGFDPFVMMDDVIYPTTFSEFVEIYEKVNQK